MPNASPFWGKSPMPLSDYSALTPPELRLFSVMMKPRHGPFKYDPFPHKVADFIPLN